MEKENHIREFIGKEIDKFFDLLEKNNLTLEDAMNYFKEKELNK